MDLKKWEIEIFKGLLTFSTLKKIEIFTRFFAHLRIIFAHFWRNFIVLRFSAVFGNNFTAKLKVENFKIFLTFFKIKHVEIFTLFSQIFRPLSTCLSKFYRVRNFQTFLVKIHHKNMKISYKIGFYNDLKKLKFSTDFQKISFFQVHVLPLKINFS